VTTRLVLNELDLDLAPLAAALVIVIIVVVGGVAGASALSATGLDGAVAVLEVIALIVVGGGVVGDDLSRHGESEGELMSGMGLGGETLMWFSGLQKERTDMRRRSYSACLGGDGIGLAHLCCSMAGGSEWNRIKSEGDVADRWLGVSTSVWPGMR
jgi:hypothetical protein